MTNKQKASEIVKLAGGNESDCLDWLNDGDGDVMTVEELVNEWREVGCEYAA